MKRIELFRAKGKVLSLYLWAEGSVNWVLLPTLIIEHSSTWA